MSEDYDRLRADVLALRDKLLAEGKIWDTVRLSDLLEKHPARDVKHPPTEPSCDDEYRRFFIMTKPGQVPRVGWPSGDFIASVREWHEQSGGEVFVVTVFGDSVQPGSVNAESAYSVLLEHELDQATESGKCLKCGAPWCPADDCENPDCDGRMPIQGEPSPPTPARATAVSELVVAARRYVEDMGPCDCIDEDDDESYCSDPRCQYCALAKAVNPRELDL